MPESEHGPIWLKAFEAGYQEELLAKLQPHVSDLNDASLDQSASNATGKQKHFAEVARSGNEAEQAP